MSGHTHRWVGSWSAETSGIAQVVNTPPLAGRVDISPQNPTTDTVLTATDSVTDIDTNDVLTRTYTWIKNGEPIEGEGEPALSGASEPKGTAFLCG